MQSDEVTQSAETTRGKIPGWQGGDEDKLGRWKRPYWDSRDGGGWVVHLRASLERDQVAVGLVDTLTARTEELLRKKMRDQDDRFEKYVPEMVADLLGDQQD